MKVSCACADHDRWVSAEDVARYLGTDRDWVYRHALKLICRGFV